MKRLQWHIQQAWRQGGLPAWVASALLLLCLLYAALVAWPAAQQVQRLQTENRALQQPLVAAGTPVVAAPGAAQQLAAFEARFADERGITSTLSRLVALAARHGVRLQEAQFRLQAATADEGFAQYTMELPVQADYPALRRFLAELLQDQPTLALQAVALQREEGEAAPAAAASSAAPPAARPPLTARLRLVLYLAKVG